MKKSLLFLFLLSTISAFGQNEITLNIFHKLGDEAYQAYQEAENNIGNKFEVKRLEYYVSEISILHDGGVETTIDDLYILVNASEPTNVPLGNYDITTVEAIRFYIGVDEASNHLDPASYDMDHPLAPQFPSMHWGWQAGYRFIAFEGRGGEQLNQIFELHGLGDGNYFATQVDLDLSADNGQININLDADYTRALEDIVVNSGVIVHGTDAEALEALENFRDYVFSPASDIVAVDNMVDVNRFDVFPNPTKGSATINLSFENIDHSQVLVQTILGTTIQTFEITDMESTLDLDLENQGVYLISLLKDGKTVMTERLIVTQ